MMVAEPFAETLQPCGQFRFVGRLIVAIIVSARLGHARFQHDRGRTAAPEAARTILRGSGQVKNRPLSHKVLKYCENMRVQERLRKAFRCIAISAWFCRGRCGGNLQRGSLGSAMIRIGPLIFGLASCALLCGPASAQGTQPENEDSRFTFFRADGGFLRLDGRTREGSPCTPRPAGPACPALPAHRAGFEAAARPLPTQTARP